MVASADIVVQGPDGTTQLIVEIKNKVPASADWAARMRRNLFAHLSLPQARFFLLALPERFYLWKDASPSALVLPDYEADAQKILRPYLNKSQVPLSELTGYSLEILVCSWLEDIINPSSLQIKSRGDWLVESGLYDAIKQGSVRSQAVL